VTTEFAVRARLETRGVGVGPGAVTGDAAPDFTNRACCFPFAVHALARNSGWDRSMAPTLVIPARVSEIHTDSALSRCVTIGSNPAHALTLGGSHVSQQQHAGVGDLLPDGYPRGADVGSPEPI
jgi:hypothetical protein